MSTRDRGFRPARRRSFDDDSFEPPTRNFGYAPPHGPQFDSPSGPPIRATVKWYNPDKGFGFVQLADGSGDALLHVSVVERSGHGAVPPGATLEVRAGPGPKGPQGPRSSAWMPAPHRWSSRGGHGRNTLDIRLSDRPTVEELGTVKWYNGAKGFDFIGPDRGGKDIFVHASALDRSGIMGLTEGQRVAIDVANGQKGPEALSLRLI